MQVAFTVKAIITASQQPTGQGVEASIAHALRAEFANPYHVLGSPTCQRGAQPGENLMKQAENLAEQGLCTVLQANT